MKIHTGVNEVNKMITRLDHILAVPDLDQAIRQFAEDLGLDSFWNRRCAQCPNQNCIFSNIRHADRAYHALGWAGPSQKIF